MTNSPLFDLGPFTVPKIRGALKDTFKAEKKVAAAIRDAIKEMVWPDNYFIVVKPAEMRRIAELVRKDGRLIFDLETSGTNPWRERIFCISIYAGGKSFVIPFEHPLMTCADVADFKTIIGPLFNDSAIRLMNHNVKFDTHFLREQFGIPVGLLYADTMLQAWVVDPSSAHGLKELCADYGIAANTGNFAKQFGKHTWNRIEPKLACYYACKDVDLVDKLFDHQNKLLERKPKMKSLFWELEMPVLNETFEIEAHGMRLDMDYVDRVLRPTVYQDYAKAVLALAPYIEPYLAELKSETVAEVCESPQKLGKVFFDKLGVPLVRGYTLLQNDKKEWARRSLDKKAIAYLKNDYPAVALLGDYRKVATVKKLFVDKLPYLVDSRGYLHPTINPIGAATGRMSQSNPNLQQIPSRMGALVRNAFIPDDGNVLVSVDFSQQEMRFLAHYSRDPGLVRIFTNDLDLYTETAIEVFEMPAGTILDKESQERRDSKILILGLGYGMGPTKYADTVGIPHAEGKRQHRKYHESFPGVGSYQKRTAEFAKTNGYIVTILGRERPLPNIHSEDKILRSKAERAAGNTPIQGSSADQVKLSLIKVKKMLVEDKVPVRIWNLVHDEIIYEVNKEWLTARQSYLDKITKMQESSIQLTVPMKSSAKIEDRWATSVELDDVADVLDDVEDE